MTLTDQPQATTAPAAPGVRAPLRRSILSRSAAGSATAVCLLLAGASLVLHLGNRTTDLDQWWWGGLVIDVALAPLGAIIAIRRPSLPVGWFLLAAAAGEVVCSAGREYLMRGLAGHSAPGWAWIGWASNPAWSIGVLALTTSLVLFPDLRPRSREVRPAMVLLGVAAATSAVGFWTSHGSVTVGERTFHPAADHWLPPSVSTTCFAVGILAMVLYQLTGAFLVVRRMRRAIGARRTQLSWVAWAGSISAVEIALEFLPSYEWGYVSGPICVLLLAVALTVALLRHNLLDIELIIERTFVYALLSVVVVGCYLVIVVGLRSAVGGAGGVWQLVATATIALGFAPLRHRVQVGVDRWLFGDRSDPLRLMQRLGRQLEAAGPNPDLSRFLATVTASLKLPGAELDDPDGVVIGSVGQATTGSPLRQSLTYAGAPIGTLVLAPRTSSGSFTRRDRELVADLAPQLAAAVHAVLVSADLRRSRRRLVAAKEEERRRLRRDLHDGLGPQLAAFGLKVDAATLLVESRPGDARLLLRGVKDDLRATLSDLRHLVDDLRPAALDQLGLVGALRAHTQALEPGPNGQGVRFSVTGETRVQLAAAVEVAAYRIAVEAVTNVVRHAGAGRCAVSISVADDLVVQITDDGRGLAADARHGVGTGSMRERAAELGGSCSIESRPGRGTTVRARLPVSVP